MEDRALEATTSTPNTPRCWLPAITAVAMSFAISLVTTTVRLGFRSDLFSAWLFSFAIAVTVAIPTAILVAPRAQRLVGRLTGATLQKKR